MCYDGKCISKVEFGKYFKCEDDKNDVDANGNPIYTIKGTISKLVENGIDETPPPDSCDGDILNELSCKDGQKNLERYDCYAHGMRCGDGKCITDAEYGTLFQCVDDPKDVDSVGKPIHTYGGKFRKLIENGQEYDPFYDSCYGDSVNEWYCRDGKKQMESFDCTSVGMRCNGGACITEEEYRRLFKCEDDPQDVDSVGKPVHTYGGKFRKLIENGQNHEPFFDSCTGDSLNEWYCKDGKKQMESFDCTSIGMKCSGGKCIKDEELNIMNSCEGKDKDKIDPYSRKIIRVVSEGKDAAYQYDNCGSIKVGGKEFSVLNEVFCDGYNAKSIELRCEFNCPGCVCYDGKCSIPLKDDPACYDKKGEFKENEDCGDPCPYSGLKTGCETDENKVSEGFDTLMYRTVPETNGICREDACIERGCDITYEYRKECDETTKDIDGDGIPDFREPEDCRGTVMTDPVDQVYSTVLDGKIDINPYYGCSCTQGAANVRSLDGEWLNCEEVRKTLFSTELCDDGTPAYCCNGILDFKYAIGRQIYEILPDCGGKCKPCDSQCMKLVDAPNSRLNILIIPISYSATEDDNMDGNYNRWVKDARTEAKKLATTPPFCQSIGVPELKLGLSPGEIKSKTKCANDDLVPEIVTGDPDEFEPLVNIWRLDIFGLSPALENLVNEKLEKPVISKEGLFNVITKDDFDNYQAFCGEKMDIIVVRSSIGCNKGLGPDKLTLLCQTGDDQNVITHELGHSLCGLSDEYTYDFLKIDPFELNLFDEWDIIYLKNHPEIDISGYKQVSSRGEKLNCDTAPQIGLDGKAKCKWQSDTSLPDSGCEKGCTFEDWYRPSLPDDDSMMKGNTLIGPGDSGIGSWTYIDYATCKDKVDSYILKTP
jgi:predicted small metal-binding protein